MATIREPWRTEAIVGLTGKDAKRRVIVIPMGLSAYPFLFRVIGRTWFGWLVDCAEVTDSGFVTEVNLVKARTMLKYMSHKRVVTFPIYDSVSWKDSLRLMWLMLRSKRTGRGE